MDIIINFFYQILYTVGFIVLFGLLIAACRRIFCSLLYNGNKILLYTGILGTPVHELSHALMCVVFGHKIVEIKLYSPNANDGTLGYVNHTYNSKNIYHQIGNFFIGVAPIICGSGVLVLLMYLLTPGMFYDVISEFNALANIGEYSLTRYFSLVLEVIKLIFNLDNLMTITWWIFMILSLMIVSHMELSTPDIKGGFKGFLYLCGILIIVDTILYIISLALLNNFTALLSSWALFITSFLVLAMIFSFCLVIIAIILKLISKLFHI